MSLSQSPVFEPDRSADIIFEPAIAPPRLEPLPMRFGLALAAVAPVAIGAILVAKSGDLAPLLGAPAIALGVGVATSPALYIALAASDSAPAIGGVARAFATALAAFGMVLCGLVLPAAFLSLSSLVPMTTVLVLSGALGGAAMLAFWRLALELAPRTASAKLVFGVWAFATLGIAARLWLDLAAEALS